MVVLEIVQPLEGEGEQKVEVIVIDPVAVEMSGDLRLYEQGQTLYRGRTIFFCYEKPLEEWAVRKRTVNGANGRRYPLNGYENILSDAERILLNCSHYECWEVILIADRQEKQQRIYRLKPPEISGMAGKRRRNIK